MTHYKKVTLTHANLKKPLHIVLGSIAGHHYSDKAAATLLYTNGGIFPVLETDEQITKLMNELTNPSGGGDKDK